MQPAANAAAGGSVTKLKLWHLEGREGGVRVEGSYGRSVGGEKNKGMAKRAVSGTY